MGAAVFMLECTLTTNVLKLNSSYVRTRPSRSFLSLLEIIWCIPESFSQHATNWSRPPQRFQFPCGIIVVPLLQRQLDHFCFLYRVTDDNNTGQNVRWFSHLDTDCKLTSPFSWCLVADRIIIVMVIERFVGSQRWHRFIHCSMSIVLCNQH